MRLTSEIRRRAIAAIGATLTALAATAASAATVNVTYQGSNPFGTPNLSRYVRINSTTGYSGGTFAGPFRLVGSGALGNFVGFCVDLAQFMTNGGTYNTAGASGYGAAVDANIDRLFTSAYASISNRVQGAAFQVALWEIISDTSGGFDLGAGNFSVQNAVYSAPVIAQANQYLGALAGAATGGYRLTFLKSGTSQDLVTVSAVPIPAAAGMLGIGVFGLFAVGRRRKENA